MLLICIIIGEYASPPGDEVIVMIYIFCINNCLSNYGFIDQRNCFRNMLKSFYDNKLWNNNSYKKAKWLSLWKWVISYIKYIVDIKYVNIKEKKIIFKYFNILMKT